MNRHVLRCSFRACAIAMLAIPAIAVAGSGDMMHVTTTNTFQMAGVRAKQAKTTTTDVCVSKRHDPREITRRSKDCALVGYTEIGDTISFHKTCATADTQMSGDAKFTMKPAGAMHGSMHMVGTIHGKETTLDVTYDATRTGACDYVAPRTTP